MKKYLIDLTERVLTTGVLAFISVASLSDTSTFRSGFIAAGTAIAQLVIGLAAKPVNDVEKAGVAK